MTQPWRILASNKEIEDFWDAVTESVTQLGQDLRAAEAYRQFVEERYEVLPHCDPRVLHSLGVCKYCDEYPEAQAFRRGLHLKFTDELDAEQALMPGENRTRASAERWGGNVEGRKD